MSEPVTRQEQLLSAIATGGDIISPITREEMYLAYLAGDTSVVLPEPITRKEQFLYQACLNGGGGGGTEITDGIVVKARDGNGYATEVDVYGPDVASGTFYYGERIFAKSITKFNGLNSVVNIGANGFKESKVNHNMIFTNLVSVGGSAFERIASANGLTFSAPLLTNLGAWAFARSTAFASILLPSCTSYNKETFTGCLNLHTTQFGSVGHGVTEFPSNNMSGCTQNELTITAYCAGSYASTLLANIRNGATNATIIIKDSTTGETIVTSTP